MVGNIEHPTSNAEHRTELRSTDRRPPAWATRIIRVHSRPFAVKKVSHLSTAAVNRRTPHAAARLVAPTASRSPAMAGECGGSPPLSKEIVRSFDVRCSPNINPSFRNWTRYLVPYNSEDRSMFPNNNPSIHKSTNPFHMVSTLPDFSIE